MRTERSREWRPVADAFVLFGFGLGASLFLSAVEEDVTLRKAILTIDLSLFLAGLSFPVWLAGPRTEYWRRFCRWTWIAALLAYLAHFYYSLWGVFGRGGRSFGDAVTVAWETQGALVTVSNFAVTVLWTLDAFLPRGARGRWRDVLSVVTRLLVLTSFVLAALVFRHAGNMHGPTLPLGLPLVTLLGGALVAGSVGGLLWRLLNWRLDPLPAGDEPG